jgi:hypothetical protein
MQSGRAGGWLKRSVAVDSGNVYRQLVGEFYKLDEGEGQHF